MIGLFFFCFCFSAAGMRLHLQAMADGWSLWCNRGVIKKEMEG